jgi:site-specific DNA-methyltransferase (adenine-specific)
LDASPARYDARMHREHRAPRNRTLRLSASDRQRLSARLIRLDRPADVQAVLGRTICQDHAEAVPRLPRDFVDLLFLDPPYNQTKSWNATTFARVSDEQYATWLGSLLDQLAPALKRTASVYLCGDWRSSPAVYEAARSRLHVRNRITWERDKGRGATANWKSNSEDIWFCTVSDDYVFNVEAVRVRRRVLAPYTDAQGRPKDWQDLDSGRFRLTCPSNLWTDITVPFWSMPENTDHPTQKPEKLLAKIILASSPECGVVLDPFLGSGTTSVVAKKLARHYVGIEIDQEYCCWCERRLELAEKDTTIQGYAGGVFWERNSMPPRAKAPPAAPPGQTDGLFGKLSNA